MKRKIFKSKFEELPALGEFVEASFLHDKDLFAAFSPVYANGFAENYHTKLQAVKVATSSQFITGKRKRVTESLHAAQDSLLEMTENIKRYCQMAGEKLGFSIDELQLADLRKNLRSRNSEATVRGAHLMQQVLKSDTPSLEEQGFTTERQDELNKLIESIETLNLEQNNVLNERRRLVEENINLLNEFWGMVQDILKTGQIIHRNNEARKTEYSEKNLMSRVRSVISSKQEEAIQTPVEEPPDNEQPVAA